MVIHHCNLNTTRNTTESITDEHLTPQQPKCNCQNLPDTIKFSLQNLNLGNIFTVEVIKYLICPFTAVSQGVSVSAIDIGMQF